MNGTIRWLALSLIAVVLVLVGLALKIRQLSAEVAASLTSPT